MSNNSNATASVNTGGSGALILFGILLVLKVNPGGHLDSPVENWSWWIITMPLWIGAAILFGVLAVAGIIVGIGATLDHHDVKKRRKAQQKQFNK